MVKIIIIINLTQKITQLMIIINMKYKIINNNKKTQFINHYKILVNNLKHKHPLIIITVKLNNLSLSVI